MDKNQDFEWVSIQSLKHHDPLSIVLGTSQHDGWHHLFEAQRSYSPY
jgi:hypothetical protein